MRKFVVDSWEGIMNYRRNPLRHIPDLQVRHMIMQVLAFIWSGVFALYIYESIFAFGISAVSHLCLILAIVITVSTFEIARKNPMFFLRKGYHSPGRSRQVMYLSGKDGKLEKIKLPASDPGGEHE